MFKTMLYKSMEKSPSSPKQCPISTQLKRCRGVIACWRRRGIDTDVNKQLGLTLNNCRLSLKSEFYSPNYEQIVVVWPEAAIQRFLR